MRQAITTKVIPATAVKGVRIRAKTPTHSVLVPWRPMLSTIENHRYAAMKLHDQILESQGVHAIDRTEPLFTEGIIDEETYVFLGAM